ncbi:MAG: cysteine desulfurase [Chloroflexi bacterium]|nr:cysteine desulfurase [Chloroflexota bacterium]
MPALPTIYLDHAATTPLDPRVLDAMLPYLGPRYGNPSSIYASAREARQALDEARDTVAAALGAQASEIVFTASGSEADTTAIVGVAFAGRPRGRHIVTSAVEHHAVLHSCEYLAQEHGFRVTYVPVARHGTVDLAALEAALDDETVLVSVMLGNNEVGTLQPIAAMARLTRARGIPLHTDAVQAVGLLAVDVGALGVDLLSLAAHKLHGPKGVGALYVRRGVRIHPLVHGGGQERGRRASTENVAGIVGLATALRLAQAERAARVARIGALRDRLVAGVLAAVPNALLTGHPTARLPHIASFILPGVESETLLLNLDFRGVAASSGSACTSGSLEPSHVLLAMGYPPELARASLRLSLGPTNTAEEVDAAVAVLREVVPLCCAA